MGRRLVDMFIALIQKEGPSLVAVEPRPAQMALRDLVGRSLKGPTVINRNGAE